MRTRAPAASVSVLILICFLARYACPQTRATVVSTNPANGATGVSRNLASFSITFSKPMDTSRCGASTRNWPYPPSGQGGSCTWSADKLTMTLTRYNPETPFAPGLKIEAYLVDPEWNPQESYLLDAQGNHIDPFHYTFTIADWPKVVSTNPPNGATGVSPYLESISITFNKPMDTSRCGASDTNWPYKDGGGSCTWSTDGRTMTLTRTIPIGPSNILVYLNLPDTTPVLQDRDGLKLGTYSFSFTFRGSSGLTVKVPADPGKGFQWPYYLYTPVVIKTPTVLLVEPNNSGWPTNDPSVDDKKASDQSDSHRDWGYDLGSPYLVPTFPRPWASVTVYNQALDRDSLMTSLPGLVRVDLQLIAMIDDARTRLAAKGITVGPKVWMIGFSASGNFANRFAVLHPDRIQAMSAGSGGEYAIAPVSTWKGRTLRYPVGVADLQQLVGHPFDTVAFSKVPVQIYIGDQQVDDAVDYSDDSEAEDGALIKEVFGGPTFRRYPASEAAYRSIGSACQFVIIPGMGHVWPSWNFIKEFLERNRSEPFPAPLPKPFLYTLYFPHVASFGQWETEIALTTTSEVPVRAELLAMAPDGGDPIESIPVTIPAVGRVEFTAGKTFKNPQDVAYIAVRSDSGFLAGYTRFSQPGNRVSLPLVGSTTEGYFTKVESDGWTGIAFVNVDGVTADVSLAAYDDNGVQVAARSLSLPPGCKYVGMVHQLFSDADVSRLRHFRFSSDRRLVGFTVSASSDGLMLDGLQSLGAYVRQR